ncbi:MAG: PQQ-dependent sugar dehydrogenase [Nocardioides sp.]|uniref:PQQ-dependent sugar dehydrogenase n=1 Tax=Nocardioides sp. TaxID=35761 RepID=UPI002396263F|nr:PQQ-dependent sugar dehydrogenase [Nocardioides sp.]MDE0776690.1 PQQ-dependent sugar dehydrogenase [Nocardioides sp.]
MRAVRALPAVVLGAVVLTGCGSDEPDNQPNPSTTTASAETEVSGPVEAVDLATGLDSPWGLLPLDDGSLLVGSRNTGVISVLGAGDPEPTRLRTIDVRAEGESGLLGLVATADESTVFAYVTTDDDSRVVAMSWDGTTLGEPDVIVDGIPGGETFHQGGALALGPDGLLYVATGDNGTPADAQDRDSLSGKVLRYDLDGSPAPDNPFGTAVFSYGHRNVEGLTFDDDGRLWASEFGQNAWDEVNLVRAGDNYGWPEVEGSGGGDEYVDPVAVWRTEDASPSGITFWDGSLWMAALRGQTLWEVPLDEDVAGDPVPHLAGEHGRLRNVVVATGGNALWVATSNTDGRGEPASDDDRVLTLTR